MLEGSNQVYLRIEAIIERKRYLRVGEAVGGAQDPPVAYEGAHAKVGQLPAGLPHLERGEPGELALVGRVDEAALAGVWVGDSAGLGVVAIDHLALVRLIPQRRRPRTFAIDDNGLGLVQLVDCQKRAGQQDSRQV